MPEIFSIKTRMYELSYEVKSYSYIEFQYEIDENLSNDRIYLFLFLIGEHSTSIRNKAEITNVKLMGICTKIENIQKELIKHKEVSHVLIILNNPWIEKVGINEDLLFEFNPKLLYFSRGNNTKMYTFC
jgi:hypothetical protein